MLGPVCLIYGIAHTITSAGIWKQSMGARNRVGIGLSYRLASRQATQPGEIGSMESILGILKSIKIRARMSVIDVAATPNLHATP